MKRVIKDAVDYRSFVYPEYELAEKKKTTVQEYLDEYNDYMYLYKLFGDEEYKLAAEKVMVRLKKNCSKLK